MDRLKGKVAIITGGGQGIGRGTALAMAKEGAKVVIAESRAETCHATAEEIRALGFEALGIVCDVGNQEQVQRMVSEVVAKFHAVDILVNNAQRYQLVKPLETLDEKDWDRNLTTGLKGTWYCSIAVLPHMKGRGGKIINFGSANGIKGQEGTGAYNAAKEGIRALSRTMAREWGKYKITVNVICPTALSPQAQKAKEDYEALVKQAAQDPEKKKELDQAAVLDFDAVIKQSALGRWGDPEKDIGRVAVFFASEDADYVSGQTLNVDGGAIMF